MEQELTRCFEVAVPTPVFSTFSYESREHILPGSRVLVPFGGRKLVGVVVKEGLTQTTPGQKKFTLKPIVQIIDRQPIFSEKMLSLARWMASYYGHPLGDVFRTMLPASVQKKSKTGFFLTQAALDGLASGATPPPLALLQKLFDEKDIYPERNLNAALKRLQKKVPDDERVFAQNLLELGYLRFGKRSQQTARNMAYASEDKTFCFGDVDAKALPLKGLQASVFAELVEKGIQAPANERKPFLLRGVTGSGKTEIYLQAIAAAIRVGIDTSATILPQTLVLVPEISLTPQMTRIFAERFAGRVAVVHSGMSDEERWRELDRIRSGQAYVLIGPRSAVFGPFANLKLIIVDEEHDSSYKQHSGLLYNGRDIAVLRAKLEGATILLGSATPSLESYEHALAGKYHLLQLPERVSGLPLPEVHIVEAKPPQTFGQVLTKTNLSMHADQLCSIPIDELILEELRKNISLKQQSIVIVNRRGFAYYLFSLKYKKALPCPSCSISLTLHKRSTMLHCHYCDYRTSTAKVVDDHPDDTFVAVGYGSEKLEQMLKANIPEARIVRLDSDTVAKKDVLTETLQKFRAAEIDILVGTQILAKGHDFPNVTLMVILDVDQLLDLPDFRATERTFQLIVQAAGRAGRADLPGRVYIQCSRGADPTIQSALKQDFLGFAERELSLRKACRYPPFARMVHVEMSSTDVRALEAFVSQTVKWLEVFAQQEPDLPKHVKVLGPAVPAIEIIRNRHRRSLIFSSARIDALLHLARSFQNAFLKPSGDIRIKIDVDPQSLI